MASQTEHNDVQEYVLRASGPEHSFTKYFLGMFPGGEPELATKKSADWHLAREGAKEAEKGTNSAIRARPWQLMDKPGSSTHRGVPEGGLSGTASSAGYFVLLKEGDSFTALPMSEFYSFRPMQRFKVNDLEEAERQMKSGERVAFPLANSRLAALVAAVEDGDGGMDLDAAPSDTDREDEEQEEHKVRDQGPRGAGAGGASQAVQSKKTDDEEAADTPGTKEGKGEDWEHEDERADDDVDMGEEAEDADASPTPPKGIRAGSDSDEDGRTTPVAQKGKMKAAGLDSEIEDDGEGEEEEDDDDDDEEDLDALAADLQQKAQQRGQGALSQAGSGGPGRPPTPKPQSAAGAAGPSETRTAKRKADVPPADAPKKAKADPGASLPSAAVRPAGFTVNQQEIIAFLEACGPIPSTVLTNKFKPRLVNAEHRKAFTELVKLVAKLEESPPGSGSKCIVLKKAVTPS